MKTNSNQLIVNAIENGTVLDHIPSKNIFKVIDILKLESGENQVTIGMNLESKTFGKKGIIKTADRFFKDEEIGRIALLAPEATINVIKGYEVVEKKRIEIPEKVVGIARCANPLCVTNHQEIPTVFTTIRDNSKLKLLCHYCEKTTDAEDVLK